MLLWTTATGSIRKHLNKYQALVNSFRLNATVKPAYSRPSDEGTLLLGMDWFSTVNALWSWDTCQTWTVDRQTRIFSVHYLM